MPLGELPKSLYTYLPDILKQMPYPQIYQIYTIRVLDSVVTQFRSRKQSARC